MVRRVTSLFLLLCVTASFARPRAGAQSGAPAPKAPVTARAQEKPAEQTQPQTPAQIELLETHYRFEADGSSRKEVHTVVKINSELGVRQFARLNFDYNRAFQSVEIPMVRVTHSSGGTADVLPSAITDNPNPAVVDAPAYQDVRVKSVRILGLEPSDTLEYRVITNTFSQHPLAPEFWLAHSFDRSGVVGKESFTLDLPAVRQVQVHSNPATPPDLREADAPKHPGREIYSWHRDAHMNESLQAPADGDGADLAITTFGSWDALSVRLANLVSPNHTNEGGSAISPEAAKKAAELTRSVQDAAAKIGALYDFVSQKIITIDLPLGATEFRTRSDAEILSSGYGTPEDKFRLFSDLAHASSFPVQASLAGAPELAEKQPPYPSVFTKLLTMTSAEDIKKCCARPAVWLDLSAEVAPFGLISSAYRGKRAFSLDYWTSQDIVGGDWTTVPIDPPFAASQRVSVDASVDAEGKLTAKVKYVMRGDNELLLRVTFHETPRGKWKDVAQLLSLADGFRGKIENVSASDPYATRDPFTVEYEISQAKFVDWAKKPVRIPAILPLVGLPDPPAAAGAAIELGTPLEVGTEGTLMLPEGFTATAPIGTTVTRDYATFSSKYAAAGTAGKAITLTASRRINFFTRELPGERAADYRAFLRAVQNDEAQTFTLSKP